MKLFRMGRNLVPIAIIVLLTACGGGGGGGGGGGTPPPSTPFIPTSATSSVTLTGSSINTTGLDIKIRFPQGVSFLSYTAVGPAAHPDIKLANIVNNTYRLTLLKNDGITNGEVIRVNYNVITGTPQSSSFQMYSSYATQQNNSTGGTLSINNQIQ